MKIAEALILRKDLLIKESGLTQRIINNIHGQEGEAPLEDPAILEKQLIATTEELTRIIQAVNRTNQLTTLEDGRTLAELIVKRDGLVRLARNLREIRDNVGAPARRYSLSEIRNVVYINVTSLNERIDELSREARLLDARIQNANWSTDLIES